MRRALLWLLAAALTAVSVPGGAAETKQLCVEAYERAQVLRRDGKLRASREQLLVCAQDRCPELVRRDCLKWLREVDDATPTIIARAKDAQGNDLPDVHVLIDGAPLLDRIDGRPAAVDPGGHVLRFVRAGSSDVEQSLVFASGEKNRIVTATFQEKTPAGQPVQGAVPPATPARVPPAEPKSSGVPAASVVLAGVAVAAAGVSAYFEIKGIGDRQHLFNTCAGHCSQSDVDFAYRELRAGDVAGAVALASLGGALWVFLARRSASPSETTAVQVGVRPQRSGGTAVLEARF